MVPNLCWIKLQNNNAILSASNGNILVKDINKLKLIIKQGY